MQRWLQIRGDPAVRRFLFDQERVHNVFDERVDDVLAGVECLLLRRGAFHIKIHFSGCRLTLWSLSDPLRYRVHLKEDVLDSRFCAAYPAAAYPRGAVVPPPAITAVLAQFKRLRRQDPHLYLRSGSLNLMNGYVGLTFSCDGSHYLSYAEFLARSGDVY